MVGGACSQPFPNMELVTCKQSGQMRSLTSKQTNLQLAHKHPLTLLAPTRSAMGELLKVAQLFSNYFNVQFNAAKCQLVTLSKNSSFDVTMKFNGHSITAKPHAMHLGNSIGVDANATRIKQAKCTLINQTNALCTLFKHADIHVKYKLFKTYCMPLYGCQLLGLESLDSIYSTWRVCLRKLFNLPPRTHSRFLPLICNDIPFMHQMTRRIIKFAKRIILHSNAFVNACATFCFNGSNSHMSSNISYLSESFNTTRVQFCHSLSADEISPTMPFVREEIDDVLCSAIIEITNILYGTLDISNSNFERIDLMTVLQDLCTS
jgi:hypothetical protein